MRVEITEICKEDAHYGHDYSDGLIGETGTFATSEINNDGSCRGRFYRDKQEGFFYFGSVKTKPIFDA